ncbi:MAG TPA: hypothetical protein VE242_00815 [Chthoniobacterales bacterium]|nr:hypothetical protein [Chthoniobacterales bacterium]
MLKPENCFIGMEFWSDGGHWRCTDVGTRTVIAIKLDQEDPRNYSGPPYMVVEDAMDEFDLQTCYATKEERDDNFPDVQDGPDPSTLVRAESGKYYRRGMEKKMVVEFNEAEFRRVTRLGQAMQEGSATESEKLWLVRHTLRSSYSGVRLYQKD